MTTSGRTIRLFLVDGVPSGILTAEIMNWTGHVSVAPRSKIADLIKREEVRRTGIYFLTGPNPEQPNQLLVYIGESDDVGKRLAQHNKDENKTFWERACVITSKDQNLTKAHVRYLESRLIAIAKDSGRCALQNSRAADYGFLPETDIADMNFFLEQIKTVLPVISLEFLRTSPTDIDRTYKTEQIQQHENETSNPMFHCTGQNGVQGQAIEIDGEFVILKDSIARASETKSLTGTHSDLRSTYTKNGLLMPINGEDLLRVTRDISFKSPSAASAFLFARSDNGRYSWKHTQTGLTYAEWQDSQIEMPSDLDD